MATHGILGSRLQFFPAICLRKNRVCQCPGGIPALRRFFNEKMDLIHG
jgi:hypothetical protein